MNKLDQRLPLTRVEEKERFRQTKALRAVVDAGTYDNFYDVAYDVIVEVYGTPENTDFENISAMTAFFPIKQGIIREIIDEEWNLNPKIPPPKKKWISKSQMQKRRKKKRKNLRQKRVR